MLHASQTGSGYSAPLQLETLQRPKNDPRKVERRLEATLEERCTWSVQKRDRMPLGLENHRRRRDRNTCISADHRQPQEANAEATPDLQTKKCSTRHILTDLLAPCLLSNRICNPKFGTVSAFAQKLLAKKMMR